MNIQNHIPRYLGILGSMLFSMAHCILEKWSSIFLHFFVPFKHSANNLYTHVFLLELLLILICNKNKILILNLPNSAKKTMKSRPLILQPNEEALSSLIFLLPLILQPFFLSLLFSLFAIKRNIKKRKKKKKLKFKFIRQNFSEPKDISKKGKKGRSDGVKLKDLFSTLN